MISNSKDMKTIFIYGVLCLVLTMSCSKNFIRLTPESNVVGEDFYKTEGQFDQAIIGLYNAVRTVSWSVAAWTMGEMRSDNTHFEWGIQRGQAVDDRENTDYFLDDLNSSWISAKYNACYVAIARANNILDQIDAAEIPQTAKDRTIGQARFLRALCYFELVRYFGGVPLYLNAVTNPDEAFLERSTVDETYDVIISDLQDAIGRLALPSFPQNGRVTKGSARMMLGDVYLTRKQWALAETEFKAVVDMGYDLMPSYGSIYALANKNNIESVFEIQFQQGDLGLQNNIIYDFLPVSSNVSKLTGHNVPPGGIPPTTLGTIAFMNSPTRDLINAYEMDDERLDASIAIAEGDPSNGSYPGPMVIDTVWSPRDYTWPAGKRAFAYIKKYMTPHDLQNNMSTNFPVYRFAQTLLSLAEVLNEQGRSAEALPYLNDVRDRADLDPVAELDQAALRLIIEKERRLELAFENKRWLDLVRTDRVIDVMTAHGAYLKTLPTHTWIPANAYTNINANRFIFPIPLREILIGKLEQNTGY